MTLTYKRFIKMFETLVCFRKCWKKAIPKFSLRICKYKLL